jgi:hypothetical protein
MIKAPESPKKPAELIRRVVDRASEIVVHFNEISLQRHLGYVLDWASAIYSADCELKGLSPLNKFM